MGVKDAIAIDLMPLTESNLGFPVYMFLGYVAKKSNKVEARQLADSLCLPKIVQPRITRLAVKVQSRIRPAGTVDVSHDK